MQLIIPALFLELKSIEVSLIKTKESIKDSLILKELESIIQENKITMKQLANFAIKINTAMNQKILTRKCDFDTEISGEMIENSKNYKNFLLFSGDGDFKYAVEKIINQHNKNKVFIFSQRQHIGQELWLLNKNRSRQVNMILLEKIKNNLIQNE